MKKRLLFILICLKLFIGQGNAQPSWPMFGFDAQHSNRTPFRGPETGKVNWTYSIDSLEVSPPVVSNDGKVFIGAFSAQAARICAVSSGGQILWVRPDIGTQLQPALSPDQLVLYVITFMSPDSALYALSTEDGSTIWKYPCAFTSPPTVLSDGVLYLGAASGTLISLYPDGSLRWELSLSTSSLYTAPTIDPVDGAIFVGCRDGIVYRVSLDGDLLWRFPTEGHIDELLYCLSYDTIRRTLYVGTSKASQLENKIFGILYALDISGCEKWRYEANGEDFGNSNSSSFDNPPAVSQSGDIYLVTGGGVIICLDSSGTIKWRTSREASIYSGWPVVDNNNHIYISGNGGLGIYNPQGQAMLLPGQGPPCFLKGLAITQGVAYGVESSSCGTHLYSICDPQTSCVPPAQVYAENSQAYGLYDGEIKEISHEAVTTAVIDIKDSNPKYWTSIKSILPEGGVVKIAPFSDDLVGGWHAEQGLISSGSHASYIIEFCRPGSVTFTLGFDKNSIRLTLVDLIISLAPIIGSINPTKVLEFSDKLNAIPLIAAAVTDVSSALNTSGLAYVVRVRKLKQAGRHLIELSYNATQRMKFKSALLNLGISVTISSLFRYILGMPFRILETFGNLVTLAIQTKLWTNTPIQIKVIAL